MTDSSTPLQPASDKHPYVAPALVVHGDVQALTQVAKIGQDEDGDGGGSFPPPDTE